ncbi:FeS cluster assembly scaffold IscU [Flagelloscypha sp. PMI_526]|nr:FeS cluster assembly scaffold IscU [Flagelloscypha sp. PMI_526]
MSVQITLEPKEPKETSADSQALKPAVMFSALARPTLRATRATHVARVARPVIARAYHEKVISHYERPRNVGSLPKGDADVGTGLVGAPACGDVMKLQIRVDENGIISDVKFKTFGCGSAIASSSYMTERVKGLSLEEAGQIRNTEIAKELCLPPVKLHCSMLAEDAIRSAIRDYKSKRQNLANPKQSGFIDVSQSAATGETTATAHPAQAV